MDPDAALKAFLEAMRDKDRDAVGEAAGDLADWLETMGFIPDVTGWLVGLKREQLVSYFRDCRAIAKMPDASAVDALSDAAIRRSRADLCEGCGKRHSGPCGSDVPRFLVRDESGRGGSVGGLSASDLAERFGDDWDDAQHTNETFAECLDMLEVGGELRIDGATVVVRVS